ncbi:unnamed protein product [Auanema sp. JU1783]|nr:unnamed protein product [Auanema sp. JU1783]
MSLRIDENHTQLFNTPLSLSTRNDDNTTEPGTANEDNSGAAISPEPNVNSFDLEEQQRVFQRFTNSLGALGGFRSPFNLHMLPNILASMQQNQLSLQNKLLGLSGSGVSPGPEDDDDNENGTSNNDGEDMSVVKDSKLDENLGENGSQAGAGGPTWSYEEQFKQLYELSDDVKRKEWLDDWLSFMHRIGKPVTRIPIMAKQVLDLYELYRLVVQHGGLVEIINKKLWREITKGLNLPSSITSAAFTLRTQYQKYLYDYECEKEGLSNPSDLQAAIDGNRREGGNSRRTTNPPNFGPLGYSIGHPAGINLLDFLDDDNGMGMVSQNSFLSAYQQVEQMALLDAQKRQLERAQRAAVEAAARQSLGGATAGISGRESTSSLDSEAVPVKRLRLNEDISGSLGGQMKITTRKPEGQQGDNSIVVSMEINGITYQGVLFALDPSNDPANQTSCPSASSSSNATATATITTTSNSINTKTE